jgi:hypothetical protein
LSLTARSPLWQVATAAAFAWLAVQSHLSGLFVAAPLLVALAAAPFFDRVPEVRRSFYDRAKPAVAAAITVIVLQIPFLISLVLEPSAPAGPTSAIASLTNPQVFRPWFAYSGVTGITGNLVVHLYDGAEFTVPVAIAAIVVAITYRKDLPLIAVSAGGILTATLLFVTSTRAYDGYWFVPLTTALVLTFTMAIAAIPSKSAVTWIGFAALAVVAWRQPARIEDSKRFFKYPQYGTMVTASRDLIMKAPAVRDIELTFDAHPTMDRFFVYRTLGGEIRPTAMWTAIFNADGTVVLR